MIKWILMAVVAAPALAAENQDVASIDKLRFHGDAVRLQLTTDAGKPYQLSLDKENWSNQECRVDIRRAGGTLDFDIQLQRKGVKWISWDDNHCKLTVRGNIKPGKALEVDLDALRAELKGQYGSISGKSDAYRLQLDGNAASVKLRGNAGRAEIHGTVPALELKGDALRVEFAGDTQSLLLRGDAVRAEARLNASQPKGVVEVSGDAARLDLYTAEGAKVDYSVSGAASRVDGGRPNTPGAPLKVRVKGDAIKLQLSGL